MRPVAIASLVVSLSAAMARAAPDASGLSPSDRIRAFRHGLGADDVAVQQDIERLLAHIENLVNISAGYAKEPASAGSANVEDSLRAERAALAAAERRRRRIQQTLQAVSLAIPIELNGPVVDCGVHDPCQLMSLGTAVLESDRIETTDHGSAIIVSEDGTRFEIAPGAVLTYRSQVATELTWALAAGSVRVERDPVALGDIVGRFRMEAPGVALVATDVQGLSAFAIRVDDQKAAHLVWLSGHADIQAESPLPVKAAWAPSSASEPRQLMTGHWAQIRWATGRIVAHARDGSFRQLAVDDEADPRETLSSDNHAMAGCELVGGLQMLMKASSRLGFEPDKNGGRLLIREGSFFFQQVPRRDEDEPAAVPAIETPWNHASVENAALEVTVNHDGRAEWTPLRGAIHLESQEEINYNRLGMMENP